MPDADNETVPFQEPPGSSMRKINSFFVSMIRGIHVLSIVCAILGSVPYLIISIPVYCSYYSYSYYGGAEPNFPEGEFWIYLSPIVQIPIALLLYLVGKGMGWFTKNERLKHLSETNERIFGVCFGIAWLAFLLINIWTVGDK